MENKEFPTSSHDDVGLGTSALRPLTPSRASHSIQRRLSSRRSRASSFSTTVSADSSSHSALSCVTRDTSRDDCAFHRFIVWVAVRRNACPKMTPSERLECPLLRCRKRFPNHELMLQHLYHCEHLLTAEYWCYGCERAERFSDSKCKKCLGQPTKRRKILSMAKNFFSSLGHKSRKEGLAHLSGDDETMLPPPSYDSLGLGSHQAELSSTEIVEIDSTEIHLSPATAIEDAHEHGQPALALEPEVFFSNPVEVAEPIAACPVELESIPTLPRSSEELFRQWINDSTFDKADDPTGFCTRPMLQLNTQGLEQSRSKTRSKTLAPSSSLRSTTSTNSTASTNTTSTGISPTSAWSGIWTIASASGIDTSLASPVSDLFDPLDLFPVLPPRSADKGMAQPDSKLDHNEFLHGIISELPADFPTGDMDLSNDLPAAFCHEELFSFNPDAATDLPLDASLALPDDAGMSLDVLQPAPEEEAPPCVETASLVASAWDALQTHASSSMAKLYQCPSNSLVQQLQGMTSRSIAAIGLRTLKEFLSGQTGQSPLDILCFVHVAYSISLVIHEEDAPSHSSALFAQALAYGSHLPDDIRVEYTDVARVIWQPVDLDCMELGEVELLLSQFSGVISRSGSRKGKERDVGAYPRRRDDPLLSASRYFLDELEYSTLPSDAPRPLEVLTSGLWAKHLKDVNVEAAASSALAITLAFLLKGLSQRYSECRGFDTHLTVVQQRVKSGYIRSLRRAELEVLRAGQACMASDLFFESYSPHVRQQFDALYCQKIPGITPRSVYYGHGIDLAEIIISTLSQADPSPHLPPSEEEVSLDNLFTALSTDFVSDTMDQVAGAGEWVLPGSAPLSCRPVIEVTNPVDDNPLEQQETDQDIGVGETPADSVATDSQQASDSRVEADGCCEICGYRPKGAPRWFKGSMAKHMKNQHANTPPKIYRCSFPGCTSAYKNRPDNLRQHQLDKGHLVDGDGEQSRRPSKRKKID